MTNEELSNQFQTLVSSYMRFKDYDDKEYLDSIEFDEYEKSLFLTKAQESLCLSLYTGRNSSGNSFDETEELRRYLSPLIREARIKPEEPQDSAHMGISKTSKYFSLPADLWFITYEAVSVSDGPCGDEEFMDVQPVTQDEYHKIKRNPFRGANHRRALRLDLPEQTAEIVCKYNVTSYYIRYLKKLKPIVLVDLPPGVSIEGVGEETPSEIHEKLHQRMLELAVREALMTKGYNIDRQNQENK